MKNISVVMASFNGEKYIEEQIKSILVNLSDDDELIISDDLSTDLTRDVVRKFNDSRIILLPVEGRLGYQKNFEKAISSSSGKFIFFSDQDDICLPSRIKASLSELNNKGCVIGDAIVTDQYLCTISESFFLSRNYNKFSAARLFIKPVAIGATMACTRSFLQSSMPFPVGIPHDHWLSVLAALRSELSVIPTPFILYRRHSNVASLTSTGKKRSIILILLERLILFCALISWFLKLLIRTRG